MVEPRLATHMMVASLLRRAHAQGDFGTVLARGDEIAGGIYIVGQVKGANACLFERFPIGKGHFRWQEIPEQTLDKYSDIPEYLDRLCKRDPDLWILELDVASEQRLAELLRECA